MKVKELISMLVETDMNAEVILSVQDKETKDYHSSICELGYGDETKDIKEVVLVGNKEE